MRDGRWSWTCRIHVLQHGRTGGADLAGERVALLRVLVDGQPDGRADLVGLDHAAGGEGPHQVVVEDPVHGRAGDGGQRVHRHVAPQLEPDLALDPVGQLHVEAGAIERLGQGVQSLGRSTRRLTQDDPVLS